MRIVGDLGKYTQFETAESIRAAASNPGGVAATGAQLGAGLAMAQAVTGASAPAAPAADPLATIERLSQLLAKGVLTQAEFDAKKTELLSQIR